MPGYVIHLSEAKQILERIPPQIRSNISDAEWKKWVNEFLCGAILPDAVSKAEKMCTHFWPEKDQKKVVIAPDLEAFLGEYSKYLNAPVVLGYYAHLHLDWLFFTDYFSKRIRFLNKNGTETNDLLEAVNAELIEKKVVLPIERLFSDAYLYGDYTKLNLLLIERHGLKMPSVPDTLENPFGLNVRPMIQLLLEKLAVFLRDSRETKGLPRVLDCESLERFISHAADDFWERVSGVLCKEVQ